jgi:hypothetical protein
MKRLILMLLLLATAAQSRPRAFGISQTEQVAKGLVAYYSMRSSSTTIHDERGTNDATAVNGVAFSSADGVVGNGANFDGANDYAVLPVGMATALSAGAMTLSAWVKPDDYDASNTILKNWGQSVAGAFHWDLNAQKSTIYISQSNGVVKGPVTTTSTIAATAWTHLVAVASGTHIDLYINGAKNGTSVSYDGTMKTSFAHTNIGAKPGDSGTVATANQEYFDGALDEIRIYDRALSLDEITQLYRMGAVIFQNR